MQSCCCTTHCDAACQHTLNGTLVKVHNTEALKAPQDAQPPLCLFENAVGVEQPWWVCLWCVCPEILNVAILSTNNPLMESHQGFILSYWHCCHDTIGLHLPILPSDRCHWSLCWNYSCRIWQRDQVLIGRMQQGAQHYCMQVFSFSRATWSKWRGIVEKFFIIINYCYCGKCHCQQQLQFYILYIWYNQNSQIFHYNRGQINSIIATQATVLIL